MSNDVVIISHDSAKFFWATNDVHATGIAHPVARGDFVSRVSSDTATWNAAVLPFRHLFGKGPLHILVSTAKQRRNSIEYECHVCKDKLPTHSFWQLSDALFVCSPELNYLQMSSSLSTIRLSEYATNICSTFFYDSVTRKLSYRTSPLVEPDTLKAFIERLESSRGHVKALRSLERAGQGSASPMETKLFIRLCYPLNDGGYGLPKPLLNHKINVGTSKRLSEQNWFVADLCWPDFKTIAEYDGYDYHQNASHDKRRTNTLEALGWKVFCITKQEMFDPAAFDIFAMQLAKALNKRIRKQDVWTKKSIALCTELDLCSLKTENR